MLVLYTNKIKMDIFVMFLYIFLMFLYIFLIFMDIFLVLLCFLYIKMFYIKCMFNQGYIFLHLGT